MIKGGFQGLDISGVDLTAQSPTLPGGYAACQAADGKTVMVLTAAGAVQCSVKKVSTNYLLAGITGDGKILSITIGSTDGISVNETEIPGGDEPAVYLASSTDITSASSDEPYTAEYDGLLKMILSNNIETSASVIGKTGRTGGGTTAIITMPSGSANGAMATVFVKKGTVMYCTGSPSKTVYFLRYLPVQS